MSNGQHYINSLGLLLDVLVKAEGHPLVHRPQTIMKTLLHFTKIHQKHMQYSIELGSFSFFIFFCATRSFEHDFPFFSQHLFWLLCHKISFHALCLEKLKDLLTRLKISFSHL